MLMWQTATFVCYSVTEERGDNHVPNTKSETDPVARLNFRLPSKTKAKIERAAVAEGLTVTDFAVHALIDMADKVLERHHSRKLTDRDRNLFLAILDTDDEPNEALRSAFEDHKDLIAK